MSDNTSVTLGQPVQYISGKGKIKFGFVTATVETLDPNTSFGQQHPLEEGQVHLLVFGPNGKTGPRFAVTAQAEDGQTEVFRPLA